MLKPLLPPNSPYQERTREWLLQTFGQEIANDTIERCDRFIEEALELIQSLGCGAERAHALVDYVFARPVGEPEQELGGVMVTLNALASAALMDVQFAADKELARCWEKAEQIREKQKRKPTGSALPQ